MRTTIKSSRLVAGFTLIEMMIAMMILSFISLAIYQNTTQSFLLRDNVEQDGDFYNSLRVTLDVMGRDLSQIFSPDSNSLPGELGKGGTKQDGAFGGNTQASFGLPTEFWGEAINTFGVRPSRLQGEQEKISFVINSHVRLYRESPESDFARISYGLEEIKNPQRGEIGKALVKREDPNVFEDGPRGKSETEVMYTLLTGIKSMQFKYLDGEKDQLFDRWDTSGVEHAKVFPAIIEITLEVYMPISQMAATDPKAHRSTFKITQRYRPEMRL